MTSVERASRVSSARSTRARAVDGRSRRAPAKVFRETDATRNLCVVRVGCDGVDGRPRDGFAETLPAPMAFLQSRTVVAEESGKLDRRSRVSVV